MLNNKMEAGVNFTMLKMFQRKLLILASSLLLIIFLTGCFLQQSSPDEAFLLIESPALDDPVKVTLADLKAMNADLIEDDYFSINSYGTEEYFHFKGVWIWAVINQNVAVTDSINAVTFIAEDNYTVTFNLDEVKREDYIDQNNPDKKYKMIIAWEEDYEPYDPAKGNPFRLILGQREAGDINKPFWVQQVSRIIIE